MGTKEKARGPVSELHIELEPVQDPAGYWYLRYTDSQGRTGLSTHTWGGLAAARRGAQAFFERIWNDFEPQEEGEASDG